MAYNARYALSPCPFCGKEAVYYQDRDGDTYFYTATCEDRECQGHNDLVFDNQDGCCKWWNDSVLAWKAELKASDTTGQDTEENGENEPDDSNVSSGISITSVEKSVVPGTYLVILTATGDGLEEDAVYSWTVVFNADNYLFTSTGPVLELTNTQSTLFNAAAIVTVTVEVGTYTSETFTVKT